MLQCVKIKSRSLNTEIFRIIPDAHPFLKVFQRVKQLFTAFYIQCYHFILSLFLQRIFVTRTQFYNKYKKKRICVDVISATVFPREKYNLVDKTKA